MGKSWKGALLTLALVCVCAAAMCGEARAAAGGSCGGSVTWTLSDAGVLTISGTSAFYGCAALTDVYYSGTTAQADALKARLGVYNDTLKSATWHCAHQHGDVVFTAWEAINSLPTTAGNYYLAADVTLTGAWSVPGGTTNLCLNGHSITQSTSGNVVTIGSGATLNLYDEAGDAGKITHSSGTGRGVEVNRGTFNMYGGEISGNKARNVGNGTGGVYLASGTFRMDGGTITGNEATATSFSWLGSGTAYGGGVYLTNGTFTMTGGTITGNTAKSSGGGVYVKNGQFEISGNPNISGNTANGSASNLYIDNSTTKVRLVIGGRLDDSVKSQKIGVNAFYYGSAFTSGWEKTMGKAANLTDCFTSESSTNQIYLVDGEARLTYQRTFTFDNNGGSGTMEKGYALRGPAFTFPDNGFTPPEGMQFQAWETERMTDSRKQYMPGDTDTFPYSTSTEFTVKALWGYAVTFDSDGGSAVDSQTVADGGMATQPADPTKSGYTFSKWQLDDADYDFSTPVTGSITLKAVWTADELPTPPSPPSYDDYDYSPATVTVPVSGDESTVNVTVSVTNSGEATLRSADVTAALDGNDSTGAVAIDVSGLTREIGCVTIPAAIVSDVAEDGAMTNQRARYDYSDSCFVFTVTHFSNYVIAYGGCPQYDTCPIAAFIGADPTAWYHDSVHWAVGKGIMGGWEDAVTGKPVFAPLGSTSRAMAAVILWRLEGGPAAASPTRFSDVPDDAWYADAVRWAADAGVITGYDDPISGETVFAPEAAATREQLAAMLWRYAKYKGADVSGGKDTNILSYGDTFDLMEYAIPAMQWACGTGIINGWDDLTGARILALCSVSSRAAVATMLMRYCANPDQ